MSDIGRRVAGRLVGLKGGVVEVLLDGQRRTSRFTRTEVSVVAPEVRQ